MASDGPLISAVNEPVRAPHPILPAYYGSDEAKRDFVVNLFDASATDYDRVDRFLSFGYGSWYRQQALLRAGLEPGMRLLDVAVGTGLLAREARLILGEAGDVVGVDPSARMLGAAKADGLALVRARGEELPFAGAAFDFLSVGYALRHLSDLGAAFREFRRLLRPGGRLLLLEMTPPSGWLGHAAFKAYMGGVVPWLTRFVARRPETTTLYRYYWHTIEACEAPSRIVETLEAAGFTHAERSVEYGIFSEYRGTRSRGRAGEIRINRS
ncbi:MAG: methyltransferase domain-containing protein [Deltaproteobacteria bacterium]|nr:methyltransferase domain-containing protein [Deltaproteobacteria bacterium]